jgi:hypothetical protein
MLRATIERMKATCLSPLVECLLGDGLNLFDGRLIGAH